MPSFDVVSKVNWHEVDNALGQAMKEISQRFDFKGTATKIALKDQAFVVESSDEYKVRAAVEVLEGRLVRRKVPLGALSRGDIEPAAGGRARQTIAIRCGIDADTGRAIVRHVKKMKLKVQVAVQGDQVRISGKKRDDLQQVIAALKSERFERPLQFENFRD